MRRRNKNMKKEEKKEEKAGRRARRRKDEEERKGERFTQRRLGFMRRLSQISQGQMKDQGKIGCFLTCTQTGLVCS